jgi:hypothetical protein
MKVPEQLQGINIAKSNWHIVVDEATGFKRSKFFETKGGILQDMCEYMYYEKECAHPIQVLRRDNAIEIMALIKIAKGKDWKLTFTMELTARKTPQQIQRPNGFYSCCSSGKMYADCGTTSRFAKIQIGA